MEIIYIPKTIEELHELMEDYNPSLSQMHILAHQARSIGFADGMRAAEKAMGLYDEIDNALAQHEADKETP